VEAIIKAARDQIKTDVDVYVTYIGKTYLGRPPEETLNTVIVPIGVLVIVCLAILTICLVKWQTKKERQTRSLKRSSTKDYGGVDKAPDYNILETTSTTFVSPRNTGSTTTPRSFGNKVTPDDYSTKGDKKGEAVPMGKNGLKPLNPSVGTVEEADKDKEERERGSERESERESERGQARGCVLK